MRLGVLKERAAGERRVAIIPAQVAPLAKLGFEVHIQAGAGEAAGYADAAYSAKGARIADSSESLLLGADVLVGVRLAGADRESSALRWEARHVAIGLIDPLGEPASAAEFARSGATLLSLELIPRITRAQSMDVLSSQATVAGYRAALLAAYELPRLMPMLMTAAGTLKAAQVLVLGAGVAGLQALATARKLGAATFGYDIRPACREQVESVGAKFVDLQLEAGGAEDRGGYARAMDEAFYQEQRERLAAFVARSDAVICTAAIPGRRSPLLVTRGAVAGMAPGSVVVDLAAERGGNCELTEPDRRVVAGGVTVLGPTNLPADAPYHASQMFSANVAQFLGALLRNGRFDWNVDDEIVRATLVARDGQIVQPRLRELLKLEPLPNSVPWSP